MITLAEFMIIAGADNRPPMLEKSLYDSWKICIEFYMKNRENGRMILDSIQNGLLVWPTITEEDGTTRKKTYAELSASEKLQADCDCKATNIVLQGLTPDVYAIVNHHKVAKEIWDKVKLLMQGTKLSLQEKEYLLNSSTTDVITTVNEDHVKVNTKFLNSFTRLESCFLVFNQGDDTIACLNKAMAFLITVASSRVNMQQVQGRQGQSYAGNSYKGNATSSRGNNAGGQARVTEDLDAYDSDCDDVSNAKVVLMANLSNYGSDVISVVFEQTPVADFSNNEIHSDSNIIPYSQYLQETQQNNESLTAELERYKERVKTFEQRLNIDLSSREKMIDSQMDDMIKEKLALKEQVDSLEQNLSKQIKEKESLLQTFTVFKNESKEKENKYMENEIDLEKKIKELDNIIFKVGQSAQTVHMLTKPQVFYDNAHKQALGYQNPFYLKKAQRIKPTLYDGIVISDKHVAIPVIDDEETLILEEESRSKMSEKEKDPEDIKQNISYKPIDYVKLNKLSKDFGKRFVPQQEFSAEQTFWYHMSNPSSKSSDASPVKMEAPKELPKVSLVNESLKNLKFHLAKFDNVVKIRTTPDARTEGEWGFEHTKAVFNNEIIPFLKSLKDIFNVFDKDFLNEIMEVQTVFEQMEAAVQQSSVDK
ncbi:hypothetical protein Tco_0465114 [Tanacetum coccineum]